MNQTLKRIAITATLVLTAIVSGCGEGGGGNTPLTATVVTSSATDSHTHTVEIPLSIISAAPADDVYQFRSSETNGHSHVIALSKAQLIDLYNGSRVEVTSSSPNSGTDHSHTWSILGGNVLYEKFCFGCHGDGKRNNNPMNVSFNSSQRNAVINPGAQPLSSAVAPVPDPSYTPPVTPTVQTGKEIYDSTCSACHQLGSYDTAGTAPDLSGKGSLVSAKFASPHNGISLTNEQIANVSTFLNSN